MAPWRNTKRIHKAALHYWYIRSRWASFRSSLIWIRPWNARYSAFCTAFRVQVGLWLWTPLCKKYCREYSFSHTVHPENKQNCPVPILLRPLMRNARCMWMIFQTVSDWENVKDRLLQSYLNMVQTWASEKCFRFSEAIKIFVCAFASSSPEPVASSSPHKFGNRLRNTAQALPFTHFFEAWICMCCLRLDSRVVYSVVGENAKRRVSNLPTCF